MSEFKTNKISPRKGTTQTIGDSGDTVSIPSGVTLSNAGTISGIQNIDWNTTKKTSAFTAVNQTGYFVDTTSAAITVTFPATPSAGNVIGLKDYANTFDTNNLIINPNGNKIQGITNNFVVSDKGAALNFIYVDSTRGWVLTDASKASDISESATFIVATGGTITCCGDYKIHTFTGPGTFCISSLGNCAAGPAGNTVDYVVVAGGGGGGARSGGGGGAGGYRESHSVPISGCYTASPKATPVGITVTATAFPITVGGGGAGGPYCVGPTPANPGSNSVFSTITSTGGGRGTVGGDTDAGPGGSGGGGRSGSAGSGNTPSVSPPQGNDGSITPQPSGSGGGGGATAASTSSNGGAGATTSITASPVARAGGGAGFGGTGGLGGGGNGGSAPGTPGTINTGGGGAGTSATCSPTAVGGNGGSGIVIIRYKYQ